MTTPGNPSEFEARLIQVERSLYSLSARAQKLDLRLSGAEQDEEDRREGYYAGAALCGTIVTTVTISGTPTAGITVTVKQGTTTIGTCVTDGAGQCSVAIPAAGSYTVSVTSGCLSGSTTISATCTTNTVTLALTPPTLTVSVEGCASLPLPGATVNYNGTNCTTGSTGQCQFPIPDTSSHTLTTSKTRFLTDTRNVTAASCTNQSVTVVLSAVTGSGMICSSCCPDPIPTTLNLTSAVYGAVTLTWNAYPSIATGWGGCKILAPSTFSNCGFTTIGGQPVTNAVPAIFLLTCSATGHWTVTIYYPICSGLSGFNFNGHPTSIYGTAGSLSCNAIATCSNYPWGASSTSLCGAVASATLSLGTTCAIPLSLSASGTPTDVSPGLYNGGSDTITVTE